MKYISINHKVPRCTAPTLSSSGPNYAQFITACKCNVVYVCDCAWLWNCVAEQVLYPVASVQNGQTDTGNSPQPPAATEGPGRKEHGSRDYRTEGSCPREYALTVCTILGGKLGVCYWIQWFAQVLPSFPALGYVIPCYRNLLFNDDYLYFLLPMLGLLGDYFPRYFSTVHTARPVHMSLT